MQLKIIIPILLSTLLVSTTSFAANKIDPNKITYSLTKDEIIKQLGWVQTNENRCGGYYIEAPFSFPETLTNKKLIQITSNELLFAQRGTSIGQGKVTISRYGQQIVANKAFLYRDPTTGKLSSIELVDHVILREPNSLVVANNGYFNLQTRAESLHQILYRTTVYSTPHYKAPLPNIFELQHERKVYQLSAWGKADAFVQDKPKIYEFEQASYSTCPPTAMAWQLAASHIELNKETGHGSAKNAKVLVKGIPVFYTPYISFPIDAQRKTGFLWPTIGSWSTLGPSVGTPFYWNMAPNYDMTITPAYLSKRGFQLSDLFRYLSPNTRGSFDVEILPYDRAFADFKTDEQAEFGHDPRPVKQGELNRLLNASNTRQAINILNKTHFNDHWSSNIDFNYVSDDYYLKDIKNDFDQVTQNQLLQLGEAFYKGQNWNFIGRIQAYQTLHPVDENVYFRNQYTRAPQLVLNGDYPNRPGGFEYFINNEATYFDIRHNPGLEIKQPIGGRLNTQPGISRPFNLPYVTVIPRLQVALTQYELGNVTNHNFHRDEFGHLNHHIPLHPNWDELGHFNHHIPLNPNGDELAHFNHPNPQDPSRVLPIFDVNTMLYFDRYINFMNYNFRQTLEPQFYYTLIPYRNQNNLPIFDTTVNTLTYDQLFVYNRFSGIDRINDANQLAMGLTTRFIDQETGAEKLKAGLGQIVYFRERKVTLCQNRFDPNCPPGTTDFPNDPENKKTLSPLSGVLSYTVNPNWAATANSIWNPQTRHLDNQSITLHYQPYGTQKIVNLGYNFVRDGDQLPGESRNSSASNLSSTDLSFNWPFKRDWTAIGRWTQNWNHNHFQNLLYGLQYDSCCWAIRFVTGRAFTGLSPSNTFQYNTQFYMQFALKGLGTVPVYGGDPTQLLNNNISGIQNNFGRDF